MPSVSAIVGTGANFGGGDVNWLNAGNITADDGANATVSGRRLDIVYTSSLRGTNCGFAIPSGSTINGVVFEVQWQSNHNSSTIFIEVDAMQLVKGGNPTGTPKSFYTPPGSMTTQTFGSSSDLWGATLSASDVNSSDFGIQFNLMMESTSNAATPSTSVDYFKITVHYTEPPSGRSYGFIIG